MALKKVMFLLSTFAVFLSTNLLAEKAFHSNDKYRPSNALIVSANALDIDGIPIKVDLSRLYIKDGLIVDPAGVVFQVEGTSLPEYREGNYIHCKEMFLEIGVLNKGCFLREIYRTKL